MDVDCYQLSVFASLQLPTTPGAGKTFSCGMLKALPDDSLSNEYYILTVVNALSTGYIGILAIDDKVTVKVTLPTGICSSLSGGSGTKIVTIAAGKTVSVTFTAKDESLTLKCADKGKDISGVHIEADYGKKLAVYAYTFDVTGAEDATYEQMIPVKFWASSYALPKNTAGNTYYKLVVGTKDTQVTIGTAAAITMNKGEVYPKPTTQYQTVADNVYIKATNPIFVASMMVQTAATAPAVSLVNGMTFMPAIAQWQSAYSFYVPAIPAAVGTTAGPGAISLSLVIETGKETDLLTWTAKLQAVPSTAAFTYAVPKFTAPTGTFLAVPGSSSPALVALTVAFKPATADFTAANKVIVKHSKGVPFGAVLNVISTAPDPCSFSYIGGACLKVRF